jgi:hypothetical protein
LQDFDQLVVGAVTGSLTAARLPGRDRLGRFRESACYGSGACYRQPPHV